MDYSRQEVIQYYHNEYPSVSLDKLEIMYDCAYDIMLNLRYPSNNEITKIPEDYLEKHKTWIFRAIKEHLDKEGIPSNVLSYSENGVNVTFDSTGLTNKLLNEIVPMAKIGRLKL